MHHVSASEYLCWQKVFRNGKADRYFTKTPLTFQYYAAVNSFGLSLNEGEGASYF